MSENAPARPRLHFHSDCPFFAGCENMLAVLMNDSRLRREFEVSYSFRAGQAYEDGLRARIKDLPELMPLPLLDVYQVTGCFDGILPPLAAKIWRGLARLLLVRWWALLWNMAVLIARLKGRRIDVLHINNGGHPGASSCVAALLVSRLLDAKSTVYVVNNLARGYDGVDRRLDWPVDFLMRGMGALFVTGSEAAGKRLSEVLGIPKRKAIPNGVGARPVLEDARALRKRIGAPEDRTLAAVVAVLEERKGHKILFQALRAMTNPPFVAIEGEGPLEAELKDAAKGLDVVFLGKETRVFDLMNAADYLVLPSIGGEDFPNVVLEAMSLGKPAIASAVAGVPEQFEDGVQGLLVPPGDAKALAEALRRAEDAGARARWGQAGRERWRSRFTPEAAADRWLGLYRELV